MQNLIKKKQNHTSHFTPHTSQKGITLIALIITIIVMLILVGVTINVALNGGLFEKAENATKGTEEKAILEEMLAMMIIDDNGKFKPDEIIANMKAKHPEYQIDDSNKPNITIKGKLGTYKYIVSETEIKIGSKEIKPFEWKDVGLTVETDVDYRFNDPNYGTEYIINFTKTGELVLKADGATVGNYIAKEYIKYKKLTIPFTYAGKTYDTTLTMNSDGINVDANMPGLGIVPYKKVLPKEYPVAYSNNGTVIIVEVSENEAIHCAFGEILPIEEVDDITKIEGHENDTVINEVGIKYSKVIVGSEHYVPAVYCEDNDKWYLVTLESSGIQRITNNMTATLDTTTSKEDLEQIIKEARDSMNNN